MAKQIKTDVTVEEYEFVDANGKTLVLPQMSES